LAVPTWRSRRLARFGIAVWLCLAVAVLAVAADAAPVLPAQNQNPAHGGSVQSLKPDDTRGLASVQLAGDLNHELLRQLNAVRLRAGLPPLRRSQNLTEAAVAHSRSMAKYGYFSHTSYNGSLFWQRVERYYPAPEAFRVYRVGENLMSGPASVSAAKVISSWMRSPPHRENLLSRWAEVGFGCVRAIDAPGVFDGETVAIVTADFGTRS
jgi:uncharacterized protein YkwD